MKLRLFPATSFLLFAPCLLVMGSWWLQAADPAQTVFATPQEAAADPDFALQGEYTSEQLGVQVIALGKGEFRTLTYRGGLPGAGWNETQKQEVDEDADGVRSMIADLKLTKVERKSPTLGAKPPAEAVVLFDGTREALAKHWKEGAKITDDGLLMQGPTSSDAFGDCSLHIEFRLPYMPQARGQGRGNSGIYIQGQYECQMLDSFGLKGEDNECGGIYKLKPPDVNMCLPPLAWQTYDIDFTAPRWDKEGKKLANARLTVRHNGVLIQNDLELPAPTPGGSGETPAPGPIHLQDHGNPVRYRNIWVVPRSAEQEARRPIVPTFERFHASTGGDDVAGGRLLLGELNCTSCHKESAALAVHVILRAAPFLEEIGKRVKPEALIRFLNDPHAAKPGTVMPDLLADLPPAERETAVLALVNHLVAADSPAEQLSDPQAVQRGKNMFAEIGCLACHAPRETGDAAAKVQPPRVSIPLGTLSRKYTIPSLTAFLQDPHKIRSSGRMPAFNLDNKLALDLASYLIGDVELSPRQVNMKFAAYQGSWPKVPNFDELKPVKTGQSAGLDLRMAGMDSNFGMRFEGFLKIERDGNYQFHLGSDDGSLLFIDGKKVVDVDGVHPHEVHSGAAALKQGLHPIRVEYIQGGGEWTLNLEFEGPGVPRQDASRAIQLAEQATAPVVPPPSAARFQFDPELAKRGKELFAGLGCANCHRGRSNTAPAATALSKPLAELNLAQGCLAATPKGAESDPLAAKTDDPGAVARRVPRFDLNLSQRTALAAAISAPPPAAAPTPAEQIALTMSAFNCYACHERSKVGGPERDRNAFFRTTIPEMGDEGRVPPPLDGVGDKLSDGWLNHILQNGAHDRPYMLTRMPKFGVAPVTRLAAAFIAVDRRTEAKIPEQTELDIRIKATGRHLVGDKALGCIKCHSFGQHKATGIQSMNLQQMSQRLREDWFYRYIVNPEAYRPGTRMPTGFANGMATIRDVYNGDTARQIQAIWSFLKDGDKSSIPEGLVANIIELKPEQQPIIFRNFIDGLTPRGIAVGYPEKGHLAWDANQMNLALLWHGRFIDAGRHWEGRGNGFQGPLGDHVVRLEETNSLAQIEGDAVWPTQPPKERGFKFRGYTLDAESRPHFLYESADFSVEDFPRPMARGTEGAFERHVTVTAKRPLENLFFLAAAGRKIEPASGGWFVLDGVLRIRPASGGVPPIVRDSSGRKELLVPVKFLNNKAEIVQEIEW